MAVLRGATPRRRLIAALAGGVLALIAVELWLRVFAPQPLAMSYRDPSGLTLHVPNARIRYARREFDHWIQFNSLGLRDLELSERKPPGVYRILVLGDSYAEAAQVKLEDSFVKRLEAALTERHPSRRWEVVNGGVSGYGTADEIRFFDLLGHRLEPDLVILAFCVGNDFSDNLGSNLFRWRDGTLEAVPQEPPSKLSLLEARTKEFGASHFHTVQFLRDRLRGLRGGKRRDEATAPVLGPNGETTGFTLAGEELTAALLDRLRDTVAAAKARFVLAAIPLRQQVRERSGAETSGGEETPAPQKWLAAFARARNLVFVDLLPPLRRADRLGRTYNRIDGHFSARGHAVAAAEILRALDDNPQILQSSGELHHERAGS